MENIDFDKLIEALKKYNDEKLINARKLTNGELAHKADFICCELGVIKIKRKLPTKYETINYCNKTNVHIDFI